MRSQIRLVAMLWRRESIHDLWLSWQVESKVYMYLTISKGRDIMDFDCLLVLIVLIVLIVGERNVQTRFNLLDG
jgi:hypothetical protein